MSTKRKLLLIGGIYFAVVILLLVLFPSSGKNNEFQPQNEFKLDAWLPIKIGGIDFSFNRAVLYLLLAAGLTILALAWIARRMEQKPNRVQTAMELAYDLTRNTIAAENIEGSRAVRWFPFIATLFFFIWFSNMLGYVPLPTNSGETIDIFGVAVPSFAIYAATANISIPLVLTLIVWISYNVQGIRAQGFVAYFRSWLPPGLESMNPIGKAAIFVWKAITVGFAAMLVWMAWIVGLAATRVAREAIVGLATITLSSSSV